MTNMSSSIGIIGGADGPTAIFVTGMPFPLVTLLLPALLVAAVVVAVFVFRKK